ncbi:phosphoadenosine phosphosulfate reductase [Rhypophila decipiens]|uniref:FAD synthase n=1 Tax=Rhypophila decipiens TaxID=261697 RepID=A0AAN6Y9I4_9PEZI|nr:phosphoadenosine phosphosulfate reductase [Rhypophila decipiens]
MSSGCSTSTSGPIPPPRALPEVCFTLRRKLLALLEETTDDLVLRGVQEQVRISMGVIEKAICMYRPEELSIAYNGGKDCLVLLILLLACLPTPGSTSIPHQEPSQIPPPKSSTPPPPKTLQAIYIAPPDPFPEVEEFVSNSTLQYDLDLCRYALPMRPALEAYLAERTAVKAVFMGTRRTDPHSEFLEHFSPTDKDWPQFMRINPVIDWHYTEIWTFIRHLGVEFCCLYERGYSSLGGVSNTRPNPALKMEGNGFRPAYELVRDDEERLGRDR